MHLLTDNSNIIVRRVLLLSPGDAQDVYKRQGVAREVLEETGLKVKEAIYRFTLPNIYVYSGFPVHTLDMFFLCKVEDTSHIAAMDDAADAFFIPVAEILSLIHI